jgi:hypothetical protein
MQQMRPDDGCARAACGRSPQVARDSLRTHPHFERRGARKPWGNSPLTLLAAWQSSIEAIVGDLMHAGYVAVHSIDQLFASPMLIWRLARWVM